MSTQRPIEAARPRAPSRPADVEVLGAPRAVDFDEDEASPSLDLDLSPPASRRADAAPPSRRGSSPTVSSIPPVLDPRAAQRSPTPVSVRPPPIAPAPPPSERSVRASRVDAHEASIALSPPPLGPRASRASLERVDPPWPPAAKARFAATILAPALVLHAALALMPSATAPLGRVVRGESEIASGVLAIVALVGAAVMGARVLGGKRSRALAVAAAGAVLLGVVMIIVTFSASEAAALGVPATAAGVVPFVAPLAPLGLAVAAAVKSSASWLDKYDRSETKTFALLASALVLVALELGPTGAVRAHAPRSPHAPATAAP